MDDKERNQFVDDLLEASLARYGSVTPRPGMEGRVVAHARAAQDRRTWFVWAGWLAAGAATALVVVSIFTLSRRTTIPPRQDPVEVVKSGTEPGLGPGPITVPPIQRALTPRRAPLQRTSEANPLLARTEVRQPVFPSPSPLSKQEELLVACLKLTPETQEEIFKKGNDTTDELEIKPLPPLADDSEGPDSEIDH